jgi:DNA-binding TFAR19-related protein (PDSD5 family)
MGYMSNTPTKKRIHETFNFSPEARERLLRLKKIHGTKKNAVETALTRLEQHHLKQATKGTK